MLRIKWLNGGRLYQIFGIMNAARFTCEEYEDIHVQNAFNDELKCLAKVKSVLMFILDGW